MSKAGKRRNREADARKASQSNFPRARKLSPEDFALLDEKVQKQRLESDELWDYATALAPISAATLKLYEDFGFNEAQNHLIANRTLGIDFYYHLKLVQHRDFDLIAVEGHQGNYTVSTISFESITKFFDKQVPPLMWRDLSADEASMGMESTPGVFLAWLNAVSYSKYRAGGPFEDIEGDLTEVELHG